MVQDLDLCIKKYECYNIKPKILLKKCLVIVKYYRNSLFR